MKLLRRLSLLFSLILIFSPVISFLCWYFATKKELKVVMVDKTVLNARCIEHASFTWMLNHYRYTTASKELYKVRKDYFGFFPGSNYTYSRRGLEKMNPDGIDSLAKVTDLLYFTDMYGIYSNEWLSQTENTERSHLIYGGMQENDVVLAEKMIALKKPLIAEFNCIGSPTNSGLRHRFEKLTGIKWTGWIGRYFDVLDTARNKELPRWLIHNYMKQHKDRWPFKRSGLAFVRNDDYVEILEDSVHLEDPLPEIRTDDVQHIGLPKSIKYSFWFEIINVTDSNNQVISQFHIKPNGRGRRLLDSLSVPVDFPASVLQVNSERHFAYFTGDFCDNPIKQTTSYFRWVEWISPLFYDRRDPLERESFFWRYYRPIMLHFLEEVKK